MLTRGPAREDIKIMLMDVEFDDDDKKVLSFGRVWSRSCSNERLHAQVADVGIQEPMRRIGRTLEWYFPLPSSDLFGIAARFEMRLSGKVMELW